MFICSHRGNTKIHTLTVLEILIDLDNISCAVKACCSDESLKSYKSEFVQMFTVQ